MLKIGGKFLHYEILEPFGEGGMGQVFRARDTKLNRDVAIKVYQDSKGDQSRKPVEKLSKIRQSKLSKILLVQSFGGASFYSWSTIGLPRVTCSENLVQIGVDKNWETRLAAGVRTRTCETFLANF